MAHELPADAPITIANQAESDERVPGLLEQDGDRALRCVLTGPVDLSPYLLYTCAGDEPHSEACGWTGHGDAAVGEEWCCPECSGETCPTWDYPGSDGVESGLTGVIVEGGDAPMHPDWVRRIRDDCSTARVPFTFAGWGEWLPMCESTDDLQGAIHRPAKRSRDEARQKAYLAIYGTICKVEQCVMNRDGRIYAMDKRSRIARDWAAKEDGPFWQGHGSMQMFRVGKKLAGRLLDGHTWDEFPMGDGR